MVGAISLAKRVALSSVVLYTGLPYSSLSAQGVIAGRKVLGAPLAFEAEYGAALRG